MCLIFLAFHDLFPKYQIIGLIWAWPFYGLFVSWPSKSWNEKHNIRQLVHFAFLILMKNTIFFKFSGLWVQKCIQYQMNNVFRKLRPKRPEMHSTYRPKFSKLFFFYFLIYLLLLFQAYKGKWVKSHIFGPHRS